MLSQAENITAEVMDMAVDNVIRSILVQNSFKVRTVDPRLRWIRARDNPTAEGANFVIVSAWFRCVNQKVHLEAIAINVSQDVQKPSFDATPVHATYDLEDT
jgi:hypothetical protein